MVRGICFYYTTLLANIVHVSCNSTTNANRWKGCKKALAKVPKGALKNEGKLWFCELSDKGTAWTLIIFNHCDTVFTVCLKL